MPEDKVQGEDAFERETRELLEAHGPLLLRLAAASIEFGLAHGQAQHVDPAGYPAELQADGACFVTLKKGGQLRGCIGSAQAHRPLVADVVENAFAAAFRDPRFPPVGVGEKTSLEMSISVLSPQAVMTIADEQDLLSQLRVGTDGLVIADGLRRALFLPSVWSQLPTPELFLGHLKAKAGMPTDHWSDGFKAWRFVAEEIYARDLDDPNSLWTD